LEPKINLDGIRNIHLPWVFNVFWNGAKGRGKLKDEEMKKGI
jgi:hypothetical protein